MTDTYVVVAQVGGFTAKGADPDNRKAKLDHLKAVPDLDLVSSLIRDDGTAELWFAFEPDLTLDETVTRDEKGTTVTVTEDSATTWMAGKRHAEHVKSAVQGASLALLNPVSVELRNVEALGDPTVEDVPEGLQSDPEVTLQAPATKASGSRKATASVAGTKRESQA